MTKQPEGTVSFLFTDIEGSTQLLRRLREQYGSLLSEQRRLMRRIFASYNGHEVDTQGDSFFVSFSLATDALSAAAEIQRVLADHQWPAGEKVLVRMGLHTGEPWLADEGYVGIDVHRAARIAQVAHGGQVLLSETTAALVRDEMPEDTSLLDLGRHRLKDLEKPERIRQLMIQGLRSEFPPLKTMETLKADKLHIPHNIPLQSTPFVGRDVELDALDSIIANPDTHLITIVGPGGTGKTRLALATGLQQLKATRNGTQESSPRFPQGVFFVPLDAFDSVAQILPSMNKAIAFHPSVEDPAGRSAWRQTLDYLRSKRMLLIMDNFEQLLDGVDRIRSLVDAAPNVKLLVTSRERLALKGEQLFPLLGMSHPQTSREISTEEFISSYSAVRLFLRSARQLQPDFTIEADQVPLLGQICRMVDGMPLALELAASWIDLLPLDEIAAEIDRGLDLLETDIRGVPERHSSMVAVFDASWKRLNQKERIILKNLSVFRGGFSRVAASQVAGASLRQLAKLVSKSLIQVDKEQARYQIHTLLRQYLGERLAENLEDEREIRDKHSAFICNACSSWGEWLKGRDQNKAMVEMERDIQNIQNAWYWAATRRQIDHLDKAVEAICSFYSRSGRWKEVEVACQYATEKLDGTPDIVEQCVLAKILVRQGWYLDEDSDLGLVQKSLELLNNAKQHGYEFIPEKAYVLRRLGMLKFRSGEIENSSKLLAESLTLYHQLDDKWGEANCIHLLAIMAFKQGSFAEAIERGSKSLLMKEALGDLLGKIESQKLLASIDRYQGRYEQALVFEANMVNFYRENGNLNNLVSILNNYGWSLLFAGQFYKANAAFLEGSRLLEELGLSSAWYCLSADVAEIWMGHYELVDKYLPVEEYLARSPVVDAYYLNFFLGYVPIVDSRYEDARQHFEQGIILGEEANRRNDLGMIYASSSLALQGLGNVEGALRRLHEAFSVIVETRALMSLMYGVIAAARLLAHLGKSARAVMIYEMVLRYPHVANAQIIDDVVGQHISAVAHTLPPDIAEEARQQGRELDPWETAAELLVEINTLYQDLRG